MKDVKDFDERELSYYHKIRSQTLGILSSLLAVAGILYAVLDLSKESTVIMLVVFAIIPVVFYRFKLAKIEDAGIRDALFQTIIASFMTYAATFLFGKRNLSEGQDGLLYALIFVVVIHWGLVVMYLVFTVKNRKNKADD